MKIAKLNLDRFGICASVLCAIHCAVVPIILTSAPLLGLSFLADERIEITMIILALIVGTTSLTVSYCRHHRKIAALLTLVAGFIIIAAGHFLVSENLESIIIPAGGLTIAASHYINWRLTRSCSSCNHKH